MSATDKFPELISEEERRLAARMRGDPVPPVPPEEVAAACRAAACCAPPRSARRVLCACLTLCAAPFWLLCAFLLGSAVVVALARTGPDGLLPALLTALAPTPMLTFVIRELHGRDAALAQLEKTCRYTPEKLWFARLWAGMLGNACLVGLCGAAVSPRCPHLLQMYFCAFTALFLVGSAALFLLSFLKNALPLSLLLAAWVTGALALLCQQEVLAAVFSMHAAVGAAALAGSFGLFALAAAHTAARRYAF